MVKLPSLDKIHRFHLLTWLLVALHVSTFTVGSQYAAPGTAGKFSYNLDSLALFQQPDPERDLAQQRFAELLMDENFQLEYNQVKGSIPPLAEMDSDQLDPCARLSIQALQQANRRGDLVPSMAEGMAIPPNVQQAIFELLASYFSDPQGDAEMTAKQLARAVLAVRAES